MNDELVGIYRRACTIQPPSPPQPKPPPHPPAISPSPPSPRDVIIRSRADEKPYDPDCFPVSYDLCKTVNEDYSVQVGAPNAEYSGKLDVSLAPCTGLESDTNCFLGCGFGSRGDFTGTYHYLVDSKLEEFRKFNTLRCAESLHPFCACSPVGTPPPPVVRPPPSPGITASFEFVNMGDELDPDLGYVGGFVRKVANERGFPPAEVDQASKITYQCRSDNGIDRCMRNCASSLLGKLRAFTVTGVHVSPPPPNPPSPPSPLRPPLPPNAVFNGCTNECPQAAGLKVCRDGGKGSFYPTVCDYGSSCALCGPREDTETINDADDTCVYANDGLCEFSIAQCVPTPLDWLQWTNQRRRVYRPRRRPDLELRRALRAGPLHR